MIRLESTLDKLSLERLKTIESIVLNLVYAIKALGIYTLSLFIIPCFVYVFVIYTPYTYHMDASVKKDMNLKFANVGELVKDNLAQKKHVNETNIEFSIVQSDNILLAMDIDKLKNTILELKNRTKEVDAEHHKRFEQMLKYFEKNN